MIDNPLSLEKIRELKGKGWKVIAYRMPALHRSFDSIRQFKVVPPAHTRLPETTRFETREAAWHSAYMQNLIAEMEGIYDSLDRS